ncbi:MAG: inositol monophosphatase, partial [Bacteroidia bacterium]|nr:inositol monophosphatase [Bacteroidia bacterium]
MDLQALTLKVCQLATDAGIFIKKESENFNPNTVEEKSKNSLVSYVDKQAEQFLVEALSKLIPDAGFIAEEGTKNYRSNTYNWIIDPLDGTTNFIHGVPCYSVSIALMQEDKLVSGVIYEANIKECFYAWQNGGAFMNGKSIQVSRTNYLQNALLATGFPYYNYNKLDEYLDLFKHLLQACRGVRRPGSAATDMAYVACGRFDGFYEYSLQPWDVA